MLEAFAAALSGLLLAFTVFLLALSFPEVFSFDLSFHRAILPDGFRGGKINIIFLELCSEHLVDPAQLFLMFLILDVFLDGLFVEEDGWLYLGVLARRKAGGILLQCEHFGELFYVLEVLEEAKYALNSGDEFFGELFLVFEFENEELPVTA